MVGMSLAGDPEKFTSSMCPSRIGGVSAEGMTGGVNAEKGKFGEIPEIPGEISPMGMRGEFPGPDAMEAGGMEARVPGLASCGEVDGELDAPAPLLPL